MKETKIAKDTKNVTIPAHELEFCLQLWEKQGHCGFGGHTKCEGCGAPYVLWKMISGEVLHGDMKRLSLEDWKKKLNELKS